MKMRSLFRIWQVPAGRFQVTKKSEIAVRAALSPLLKKLGIPFHEELLRSAAEHASGAPAAASAADELVSRSASALRVVKP
jgi:hypothetical protein